MLPILSFITAMSSFDCALPMGVIGVLDTVYFLSENAHLMFYCRWHQLHLLPKVLRLVALSLSLCNRWGANYLGWKKDLLGIHAMAAMIKKTGELNIEAEQHALSELQKATESLNCEYPIILRVLHILECTFLIRNFPSSFWLVIDLNLSEENKRVHEWVEVLTDLSQAHGVFWTKKSKGAIIAKFQDQVQQVHRFFDKCHAGLKMIWKTTFST
jgi:hypothetical protein